MSYLKELTRSQKKNLKMLATYLESLPKDYLHFTMGDFLSLPEEEAYRYVRFNGGLDQFNCGAVACALGHGPSAGVLFRTETGTEQNIDSNKVYYIDWLAYSKRFVPSPNHILYYWFFGWDWTFVDDTPHGAAARIWYILDGNTFPHDRDSGNIIYGINDTSVELYSKYLKKD